MRLALLCVGKAHLFNSKLGGYANKVIARWLDITEGTVKGHVKHLLKKLDCRSRVEAAVWAAQQKTAE